MLLGPAISSEALGARETIPQAFIRMIVVYVAGPYRAAREWQVVQNIRRAEALALKVWESGAACICPHKNTALLGGAADDRVWLEGDRELVLRSDAVLLVEGWQSSRGAVEEVSLAKKAGIPVFEGFDEYSEWLNSQDQNHSSGE